MIDDVKFSVTGSRHFFLQKHFKVYVKKCVVSFSTPKEVVQHSVNVLQSNYFELENSLTGIT